MLGSMTPTTAEADPACPAPVEIPPPPPARRPGLMVERRSFETLDRATWDALAARNPWATPFSSWAFHRAWWDAYGRNAHDQTMVVLDPDGPADDLRAIVPLMHRHHVEPTDAEMHTTMRHGQDRMLTPVPASAKGIFFGASYHADYATILADPADVEQVAAAVVAHLEDPEIDPDHPLPWDVVDLRRLRCGDPAADALATAFGAREMALHWTLNVEREDVCPVLTLPEGIEFDDYLGGLTKKARHEIRRKVRRAEAQGDTRLDDSADPLAELDGFIDMHQKRWGALGLFPQTAGGTASRTFIRRLFELFGAAGPLRLTFLSVGGRRIGAGLHFETADGYLYYNAGLDPDARDLSPGVLMIERYVRRAIASGKRRLDFLRGDEPYKYEWGAVDEPIQRILVRCAGIG
jgi:CelD/BcsL family acetyltransferase involved in cellulose biosynthesis